MKNPGLWGVSCCFAELMNKERKESRPGSMGLMEEGGEQNRFWSAPPFPISWSSHASHVLVGHHDMHVCPSSLPLWLPAFLHWLPAHLSAGLLVCLQCLSVCLPIVSVLSLIYLRSILCLHVRISLHNPCQRSCRLPALLQISTAIIWITGYHIILPSAQ